MSAILINGQMVSIKKRIDVAKDCLSLTEKMGHKPSLHVLLVGENPASHTYVHHKQKACKEVGIECTIHHFPENSTEETLCNTLIDCMVNRYIHGILIQLPLPKHISLTRLLDYLPPLKDVDGFHPINIGRLAQNRPLLRPCTPYGIIQLLDEYDISMKGKDCLILGTSQIVGLPMGLELLNRKATVTYCHRDSKNIEDKIRSHEIIISATGTRNLIQPSFLNSKQIIIDVGIHRNEFNQIVGDLEFEAARERVAFMTPVPGGVGPMTITALLQNVALAARLQLNV
jgi:methylenetetrahydrofolate dehydrogenase (NADP+)/methenyltetrahydrofolate cyclohydrolase